MSTKQIIKKEKEAIDEILAETTNYLVLNSSVESAMLIIDRIMKSAIQKGVFVDLESAAVANNAIGSIKQLIERAKKYDKRLEELTPKNEK